eukprot:11064711-Alexandrium_andersonii.AAC.1
MPGWPTRKPDRHPARSSRPAPARSRRSHAPGPPSTRSRACLPAPCWDRCSHGGSPRTTPGTPPSAGCPPPGA